MRTPEGPPPVKVMMGRARQGPLRRGEEAFMTSTTAPASTETPPRPHFMQRVLDNPFLLLFLGVVIPTVFYILWGIMEIISVPLAPS
jgi:hypothetical protein